MLFSGILSIGRVKIYYRDLSFDELYKINIKCVIISCVGMHLWIFALCFQTKFNTSKYLYVSLRLKLWNARWSLVAVCSVYEKKNCLIGLLYVVNGSFVYCVAMSRIKSQLLCFCNLFRFFVVRNVLCALCCLQYECIRKQRYAMILCMTMLSSHYSPGKRGTLVVFRGGTCIS